MLNCDGFMLDYCTLGSTLWFQDKTWKEPMWLCDRHLKMFKEAEDAKEQRVNQSP